VHLRSRPVLPLHLRDRRAGELSFAAGQFVSAVAPDANGKLQTRAYSIASAPNKNQFELCVNRVEEGFFSNHLADLPDLPIGAEIQIHGPHGHFILKEPITDSILVATGTGIAPMRGYLQWLFPAEMAPTAATASRSGWSTARATRATSIITCRVRGAQPPPAELPLSAHAEPRAGELDRPARLRSGARDQDSLRARRPARPAAARAAASIQPLPASELTFDIYAYICGLNEMVSGVRERLTALGWHRKQIVFERYD
jgi:ferredoxin-NADP reductase